MPDRRSDPKPKDDDPWKPVHHGQKHFDRDAESTAVFQSRRDPLHFLVTRSFIVGDFEQDQKMEHRAIDQHEAQAILRDPESLYRRLT